MIGIYIYIVIVIFISYLYHIIFISNLYYIYKLMSCPGIAGCSGCGKSTLAKTLAKDLASPVTPVSLDWYLRPKWMPKVGPALEQADIPWIHLLTDMIPLYKYVMNEMYIYIYI